MAAQHGSRATSCCAARWAAMALRKARRLVQNTFPMPMFEEAGRLEDARPSRLTGDAGVYWVCFDDRSAILGVADNLRLQIDSFESPLCAAALPPWLKDRPVGKPRWRYLAMPSGNPDKGASLFAPRVVA